MRGCGGQTTSLWGVKSEKGQERAGASDEAVAAAIYLPGTGTVIQVGWGSRESMYGDPRLGTAGSSLPAPRPSVANCSLDASSPHLCLCACACAAAARRRPLPRKSLAECVSAASCVPVCLARSRLSRRSSSPSVHSSGRDPRLAAPRMEDTGKVRTPDRPRDAALAPSSRGSCPERSLDSPGLRAAKSKPRVSKRVGDAL